MVSVILPVVAVAVAVVLLKVVEEEVVVVVVVKTNTTLWMQSVVAAVVAAVVALYCCRHNLAKGMDYEEEEELNRRKKTWFWYLLLVEGIVGIMVFVSSIEGSRLLKLSHLRPKLIFADFVVTMVFFDRRWDTKDASFVSVEVGFGHTVHAGYFDGCVVSVSQSVRYTMNKISGQSIPKKDIGFFFLLYLSTVKLCVRACLAMTMNESTKSIQGD
jgi:hypothetical protein